MVDTYARVDTDLPTLAPEEVAERITALREAHSPYLRDRIRIRQIMNGGVDAIVALLGPKAASKLGSEDLPVVHLMDSGMTKLAQSLGLPPDCKVDPIATKDTKREKDRAQKREYIVAGLDYQARFNLTLPWAGRWLPGYAFVPWMICEGKGRNGSYFAKAEIRNSFDCFPGQWGPDSQPEEIAFIRLASKRRLARQYPWYAAKLDEIKASSRHGAFGYQGAGIWNPGRAVWEGPASSDAVLLAEYIDSSGTYLMTMDHNIMLDIVPNPLEGPAFVLAKRPSFDALKGQYDHVIGLMGMMAKLNILAYLSNEDAVFRETNIIGEMVNKSYGRGRFATNFFAPGTRIEKPSNDIGFQVFNQIDRIERQLRIGTAYSVVEDSESPNSYATGRGIDRLTAGADKNVREYFTQLGYAIEMLDGKRLEWEEKMYGSAEKSISGNMRGTQIAMKYRPTKDIGGMYDTRRVYGMMAGWDEPEKIVIGLQLMAAEALDIETFQDNLEGLENKTRINTRVRQKKAENRLFDMLSQAAAERDPRAEMAMVEIMASPDDMEDILSKYYTPEEPQPNGDELAMMAGGMPPGMEGMMPPGMMGPEAAETQVPGQAPDDVSTVLSRLMSGGQADAGIQTVGRLA